MQNVTENTGLTREEALDAIDKLRDTLPAGGTAHDALAPVVRDLWDRYPIEDAKSSLEGARWYLPSDIAQAVADVLDRVKEDDDAEACQFCGRSCDC